jgi:hypothetical protein
MKKLILASLLVLLVGCANTGSFVANENSCTILANNTKVAVRNKIQGYSKSAFKAAQSELTKNSDELSLQFKLIDAVYDDGSIDSEDDLKRTYDEIYNRCMSEATKQEAASFMSGVARGMAESMRNQTHCHTTYGRDIFGNITANTNCW